MSTPETDAIQAPKEPARPNSALASGGTRLTIARILAVLGVTLSPGVFVARLSYVPEVPLLVVGVVGIAFLVLSWLCAPVAPRVRTRASVWLAAAVIVTLLVEALSLDVLVASYLGLDGGAILRYAPLWFSPLTLAAGVCGWLALRARPRRSYVAIWLLLLAELFPFLLDVVWPPTLMGSLEQIEPVIVWVLCAALPAVTVLLAARMSSHEMIEARERRLASGRSQSSVEVQARVIRQWQAAYALANPGQPIPVPPAGLGEGADGASNHTNMFAILAIIFGFFISILGIVFGHVALSQIRRTGERGRGLAITGLVLGYLGVILTAILFVLKLV